MAMTEYNAIRQILTHTLAGPDFAQDAQTNPSPTVLRIMKKQIPYEHTKKRPVLKSHTEQRGLCKYYGRPAPHSGRTANIRSIRPRKFQGSRKVHKYKKA